MVERPQEDETLSQNPLSDDWQQVAYDMSAAVDEMLKRMDLEFVQIIIGSHYTEVVQGGELPTNDFFDAVKRDLDTHGKLIVSLHPAPPPEGYDHVTDVETLCAIGLESPEGEKVLRVFWIGDIKLQTIIELAKEAAKHGS